MDSPFLFYKCKVPDHTAAYCMFMFTSVDEGIQTPK